MTRKTMRWWGWGDGTKEFDVINRPYFWPWVKKTIPIEERTVKPVARESIHLSAPNLDTKFLEKLKTRLRPDQLSSEDEVRLCHSYGKSYRDLLRMRMGIVSRSPDLVVYPESHEEVNFLILLAQEHDICLIPFGGGTNIVGAVEPSEKETRMIVTLHMGSMNRMLHIDGKSMTATFEVGILGPDLEAQLNALGFSLGHIPDSFEYSSLGGWIATRSAGQQSDAYGKIEEMVVAIKMATPIGTLITKPTPACAIGPDLNQFTVGSEGTFGIITEATMRIHPVPPVKEYYGFLFPRFEEGVQAIYEMVHGSFKPSMIRLLDTGDTELALHTGHQLSLFKQMTQHLKKFYLMRIKGYTTPCLMLVGFEGEQKKVSIAHDYCAKICKKNKGISAGASVGKKWRKGRFDVPYLRDFIMGRGLLADVAETATTWSNLLPLYYSVREALLSSMMKTGHRGWVGCHISHSYETGASLYFTYACQQALGREFEQYNYIKGMATAAIVNQGGSLSHHHSIGYEHQPWLEQEIGETGIKALQGLKATLDPKNILNPGKLMQQEPSPRSGVTGISLSDLAKEWTRPMEESGHGH